MKNESIKRMAIILTSLTMTISLMYQAFTKFIGIKPFSENQYYKPKTTMVDRGKNGISYKYIYTDEELFEESVVIRTPYYYDNYGNIRRGVYAVNINQFSNIELEHIYGNVSNQDILLNQEYIKNLIDNNYNNELYFFNHDIFNFICSEYTYEIPEDNNFEISYATYVRDNNDVWYYKSKTKDAGFSLLYILSVFLISNGICSLSNEFDEKRLVLEKKNKVH